MSAKPKIAMAEAAVDESGKTPKEQFRGRQSKELVVAFSGPMGCGLETVVDAAEKLLKDSHYNVVRIKISEFIETAITDGLISLEKRYPTDPAGRITRLQDAGNELRNKYKNADILAEFAIRKIAAHRTSLVPKEVDLGDHMPAPTAYIIDQLKNPAEAALFRTIYRNLFFLIGVLSVEGKRKKRLTDRAIKADVAASLIERDRKEPADHGQQLDKTLEMADFFVRNDHPNAKSVSDSLDRFLNLIHGENVDLVLPRKNMECMWHTLLDCGRPAFPGKLVLRF